MGENGSTSHYEEQKQENEHYENKNRRVIINITIFCNKAVNNNEKFITFSNQNRITEISYNMIRSIELLQLLNSIVL